MTELKENQLVFVDEKGNEILCDIIFTYDSPEFKKSYVFFSPTGSEDEDGKVEVGVASYEPKENGIGDLSPIEDEAEWDMLAEVFNSFAEEHECDCDCDDEDECDCECDCDCDDEDEDDCDCCCCHHNHDDEE